MLTTILISAVLFAATPAVPTSQPTAQATSQPSISRYYSLLRYEFIKTDRGIELNPKDVQDAITKLRTTAQAEKKSLDQRIAKLTQEIREADADQKASVREAREQRKTAARHQARAVTYEVNSGRVTARRSTKMLVAANKARKESAEAKADAADAKSDVSAARAELARLKRQSSGLAWSAPHVRSLPPKQIWKSLPDEMQKKLSKVGITQDEFKNVLKRCGISEAQFISAAVDADKKTKTQAECAEILRKLIASKMK